MTSTTATIDFAAQHRRGRLFIALAAIAWSTAGLFQRGLSVDTPTQLAGRAVFAVLGLLGYVALSQRRNTIDAFRAIGRSGLAVAALMAISSGAFIVALNHTSVANVLFMQALAPILAASLGSAIGEPVARRAWVAMAIAFVGVALMVGGPNHPNAIGTGLSLLMAFSFAATLVITRHRREVSMVPATCLSQVLVLIGSTPFAHARAIDHLDLSLFAALGIGQIGLGLVFLTLGARLIPAPEVALIILLEIVLGPLWVWIVFSEQPAIVTLIGGAIVLAAVAIQASRSEPKTLAEETHPSAEPPPP